MNSRDILSMAVRNLLKRKLRTSLTVFGVIIGVVSIVLMLSMGIGINMNFDKQMEGMGDLTLINIYNWEAYNGQGSNPVLDDEMLDKIAKIEGVLVTTPVIEYSQGLKTVSGRRTTSLRLMGIKPEAMEALGYTAREGSLLSAESSQFDIVYGANVIGDFKTNIERAREEAGQGRRMYFTMEDLMSEGDGEEYKVNVFTDKITASYYYNYGEKKPEYPKGKKPDIYTLNSVGILEPKENDWYSTTYCFMPIETIKLIQKNAQKYEKATGGWVDTQVYHGYEQGYVKCTDVKSVEYVMDEIEKLGFNKDYLGNPTSWINSTKQTAASLQALLAGIGAVALFVAAIGIANTMIMSIYERTREIGVMKVIGAALKDIKKLFLLEAALIGMVGGVLGLALSYLASYIFNNVGLQFFADMVYLQEGEKAIISFIPSWLALGALVFAALIGLVSGYMPARRATKLSALSAIKSE